MDDSDDVRESGMQPLQTSMRPLQPIAAAQQHFEDVYTDHEADNKPAPEASAAVSLHAAQPRDKNERTAEEANAECHDDKPAPESEPSVAGSSHSAQYKDEFDEFESGSDDDATAGNQAVPKIDSRSRMQDDGLDDHSTTGLHGSDLGDHVSPKQDLMDDVYELEKNEFPLQADELPLQADEFPLQADEFPLQTDEFDISYLDDAAVQATVALEGAEKLAGMHNICMICDTSICVHVYA
jgi:hypothetical protein